MKRSFIAGLLVGAAVAYLALPTDEDPILAPIWCFAGTFDSIDNYPHYDNVKIIPNGNTIEGSVDVFVKCGEL